MCGHVLISPLLGKLIGRNTTVYCDTHKDWMRVDRKLRGHEKMNHLLGIPIDTPREDTGDELPF